MRKEILYAIVFIGIICVGIGTISYFFNQFDLKNSTINNLNTDNKKNFQKAPMLNDISGYINVNPDTLQLKIDGNVVVYDFWTYSCINCIRTLPYLTDWDQKYRDDGLVIIGIHSPEFEFEKEYENVKIATEKFGIEYPVIQDNEKEIWNDFQNRYWPRKYIADHEGFIRFDHIGEGAYQETEKVIQKLLKERSKSLGKITEKQDLTELDEFKHSTFRTPELYFGYNFAQGRNQLGNDEGFSKNQIVDYDIPEKLNLHYFYLDGKWENNKDGMKLISNSGKIILNYNAKQVNIVASNEAIINVKIDGKTINDEIKGNDISQKGILEISEARLYNLINSENSERHEIVLEVLTPGFEIFTFTFG